jgi:hypothetical protein
MLTYQCSLWCVAALTMQHIITSSTLKFWASLADGTWLFTHYSFCFSIFNNIAPEDIHENFNELSFLHNQDEAPVSSH